MCRLGSPPEPTAPVVEVMAFAEPPPPSPPPSRLQPVTTVDGLETLLLIPDPHHPNADMRAWGVMLRAAMLLQPSTIVILGDFADGAALSGHAPTTPDVADFEVELAAVRAALDQLDRLGASRKVYCEGNHEQRLDRFLAERAPGLYRSLRWPQLLDLERRGWEWIPYRKSAKVGKLHVTHDTGSAGMNAHRSSSVAFGGSCVIGHTHRMAYEARGRFDGSPYLSAMLGWLGDASKAAEYLHEAKASDWVHGFGVGYMEPSGVVHLQPVPIVGGRCVVQGRLVD